MIGEGKSTLFTIFFTITYTLAFYFNWAAFKYYPLVREFHIADQAKQAGPPISWYGWIVTAALISAAVTLLVPRSWADRLSPTWAWLAPAVVLISVLVYEKRWFV